MQATRRVLFSTIVVLAGASIASADLFHYFPIEEGTGNSTANLGSEGTAGTIQSPGNGLGIAGDHWVLNGTRGAVNRGTVLSGNNNNSTSSHVTTAGIPTATYNGNWTQTIWAAVDGDGNDVVLGHRFGGPGGFAKLDTNNFEWQAPGGGANIGPGTGTDGLWHQYTIVKTGNQFQTFQDGASTGTGSANGTFGGTNVPYNLFGDGGERPGGLYDEVGFFDEALSAEKVTAMYNLGDTTQNAAYGLLDIDNIFGVFDDGGEYTTPDGLVWMQAAGLNGGAGVLVDNGDSFEIQLDSAGNGVVGAAAVIPEPTTIAIWSLLGAMATFFAYRRSRRET